MNGLNKLHSQKYLALLRGVNVGGKGIIKMADLKAAFEECGFENVLTYIQSGNVIFDSNMSRDKIEQTIITMLNEKFNIESSVALRTSEELSHAIEEAPSEWRANDNLRCYMAFIIGDLKKSDIAGQIIPRDGVDSLKIGDGVLYLSSEKSGLARSGFTKMISQPIYKQLTMRNLSTVEKIFGIMREG